MDPPVYRDSRAYDWFIWLWKYHRHRILDYVSPNYLLRYREIKETYHYTISLKQNEWMRWACPTADLFVAGELWEMITCYSSDPHCVIGYKRFIRDYTNETGSTQW